MPRSPNHYRKENTTKIMVALGNMELKILSKRTDDDILEFIFELARQGNVISVSFVRRVLRIGYRRANRIVAVFKVLVEENPELLVRYDNDEVRDIVREHESYLTEEDDDMEEQDAIVRLYGREAYRSMLLNYLENHSMNIAKQLLSERHEDVRPLSNPIVTDRDVVEWIVRKFLRDNTIISVNKLRKDLGIGYKRAKRVLADLTTTAWTS